MMMKVKLEAKFIVP